MDYGVEVLLFVSKLGNVAATAEAAEVKVTTANLNLRTGPSTSYQVILVIPKGAQVEVTGYSGNWAKVTYNPSFKKNK